ncbi:MAG TPA: hypothetical protein VFF67_09970 [Thermoplasmata archaeon]|nr:hypothetical protein [Thermoplasmata archaeon]
MSAVNAPPSGSVAGAPSEPFLFEVDYELKADPEEAKGSDLGAAISLLAPRGYIIAGSIWRIEFELANRSSLPFPGGTARFRLETERWTNSLGPSTIPPILVGAKGKLPPFEIYIPIAGMAWGALSAQSVGRIAGRFNRHGYDAPRDEYQVPLPTAALEWALEVGIMDRLAGTPPARP